MTVTDRSTAESAEDLRARVTAGDSTVSAAALAAAEAAERVEQLRAEGERRRAAEHAAWAEARAREAEQAAVQAAWQRLNDPETLAALARHRGEAVVAVLVWLRAVRTQAAEWLDMVDRAHAVDLAIDDGLPPHLRGLLGQLGRAVKEAAVDLLPSDELELPLDSKASSVWETS